MSLLVSAKRFTDNVKARLQLPLNTKDQLLARGNGEWLARPTAIPLGVATNDTELTTLKGFSESFSEVFNNWQRISRIDSSANETGDYYSDSAIAAELAAWTFDSANNRILSTTNTISLVGFISPQRFDDYVFETTISSINGDDDFIGLCIAHATNETTGYTEILTVMRALNGRAPMVVDKNFTQHNGSGSTIVNIAKVYSGLKWANGTVAADGVDQPSGLGGWNLITGGVRLKVTRAGDLITIETSQVNESTYFAPATTVIDLSANAALAVFRGPQRYGYVCQSQASSTWATLQRPGAKLLIHDTRNDDLWSYSNGVWSSVSASIYDLCQQGVLVEDWLVLNPVHNRFYYVSDYQLRAL